MQQIKAPFLHFYYFFCVFIVSFVIFSIDKRAWISYNNYYNCNFFEMAKRKE